MSIASDLATLGDGPTPGSPALAYLTSTRLAALVSAVRGLARGDNIQSGIGVIRKSVSGGVILSAKPAKGGGGGTAVSSTAFDVDVAVSGEGYRLSVAPGTVNGLLPQNYDITYTTGAASDCVFLLLTGTVANGGIVSATLSFSASVADQIPPNAEMPPSSFSWTLGMLVAGKWHKLVNGSLVVMPTEVFRTSKSSYLPGELPYKPWYAWAVTYS